MEATLLEHDKRLDKLESTVGQVLGGIKTLQWLVGTLVGLVTAGGGYQLLSRNAPQPVYIQPAAQAAPYQLPPPQVVPVAPPQQLTQPGCDPNVPAHLQQGRC